jgi:hypothetical protein
MPFKNPEDKKLWRERNRDKQRQTTRAWERRMAAEARPAKERARQERIARRELADNIKLAKWAIGEVRRRIMVRDGVSKCHYCHAIKPHSDMAKVQGPNKLSGECKQCRSVQGKEMRRAPESREKYQANARAAHARIMADPERAMAKRIKDRVSKAIRLCGKGVHITGGRLQYLGCTAPEAYQYITAQLKRGMTWGNYGKRWHIDHITPCASFDLTSEDGRRKAFHYTNLRPLNAVENMRKGAKITVRAHQPALLI